MFYKTLHGHKAHTTMACRSILGHDPMPMSSSDKLPLCELCGNTAKGLAAGGIGAMVSGEHEEGSTIYEIEKEMHHEYVIMLPNGEAHQVVLEHYQLRDWELVPGREHVLVPRGCAYKNEQVVDKEMTDIDREIDETMERLRNLREVWPEQRDTIAECERKLGYLTQRKIDRQFEISGIESRGEDLGREQEERDRQEAEKIRQLRQRDADNATLESSVAKAAEQVSRGRDGDEDTAVAQEEKELRESNGQAVAKDGAEVSHRGRNPQRNAAPLPRVDAHPIENMRCKARMRRQRKDADRERKQQQDGIRREYNIRIRQERDPKLKQLLAEERDMKISALQGGYIRTLKTNNERGLRQQYDMLYGNASSMTPRNFDRQSQFLRRELSKNQEEIERTLVKRYFPHLPEEIQTFDAVWGALGAKDRETFIALVSEDLADQGGIGFLGRSALQELADAEADAKGRPHQEIKLQFYGVGRQPGSASQEVVSQWSPWMQAMYAAAQKMHRADVSYQREQRIEGQIRARKQELGRAA